MKKSIVLLISLLMLNCSLMPGRAQVSDTLRIMSTADLFDLTTAWAYEYSAVNPGMRVKVILASDNKEAEEFLGRGMLGFISARTNPGFRNHSGWSTLVGREVIVPVINSNNPALEKLNQHGITAEMLLKIANSKSGEKWNSVIADAATAPVNYYWINDESLSAGLAGFLGSDILNTAGYEVKSSEDFIAALRKDPYGIGFCKLTAVTDLKNQTLKEGLSLLPIDRNNNGTLDYSENIYGNFNQLTRAIWIGKFPKQLYSNIYAASLIQPAGEASSAFLKWVLTDGQRFLYENGYNDLLLAERQKSVDSLYETEVYAAAETRSTSPVIVLLFLFAGSLILVFAADRLILYFKRKSNLTSVEIPESNKVFGDASVIIPQGIYFDKTHTWAFMEQDGNVKVGIDDFLQHITGPITRVKMKKDGSRVRKGEQILSLIQNGKNLDLYAPVSGIIKEHNSVLETNSGLINTSPYNEGWVYKIEPSNWQRENQLLFFAEKYKKYLSQEFSRLKDFLASVMVDGNEKYSYSILQDGGELHDGLLSQMGPEVWEDFQTKYIDPSRQIWFYEMF